MDGGDPDCAGMIGAIKGYRPQAELICGKPSPQMPAPERLRLPVGKCLIIGDR